jgi:hypothetical protein
MLSLFTGLGAVAAVAIGADWLRGVATYSWERSTCTMESSEVVDRSSEDGYGLRVSYRYRFRDRDLSGEAYRHGGASFDRVADAERLAARYEAGRVVSCWVDPDDPSRAYLVRADLWRGLWILLPLAFCAIGGVALWLVFRLRRAARSGGDVLESAKPKRFGPFRAGLALTGFFGVFFLFGLGVLLPFFVWPALQVMEARSWRAVPCRILSSDVATHRSDDGVTYSVEALYRYEVDGREHRSNRYQFMGGSSGSYDSKAAAVAGIPEGAEVTCWVNPEDPFDAVIERGFTSDYFFGAIPLLFVMVGLGGMVFTLYGARAAKRSAAGTGWREVESAREVAGPVVLEPRSGPLGKLGCSVLVALAWNGFVSLFVWQLVEDFRADRLDWFPVLVLTPFVLVGLLFLAGVPYSVLALLNPRPRLRLSRRSLAVGETAQLDWSFVGWSSRLRGLRVWLEGSRTTTETEVHERGASVRSSTEAFDTIEILHRGPDEPLESGSVGFTVPATKPPTSEGADESISWKLKLQGAIAYWPDVIEEYEIRVLPAPRP